MLGKLFGGGGDPIAGFWDWFEKNQDAIRKIETGQERIVGQFGKHLQKIHPSLVFQGGDEGGIMALEISADGDKNAFGAVKEVVSAAPSLPGFKFYAFRQRSSEVDRIEMPGISVAVDEVFFHAVRRGKELDVSLFIDGLTSKNREMVSGAMFILLDALVGEYDVEMKIGAIDFEPLASHTGPVPLRPLTDLPAEVDALPV